MTSSSLPPFRVRAPVAFSPKSSEVGAPDLPNPRTVAEALATPCDVLIDYTVAGGRARQRARGAVRRGVAAVIGTSGLTEEDFAEIDTAAVQAEASACWRPATSR